MDFCLFFLLLSIIDFSPLCNLQKIRFIYGNLPFLIVSLESRVDNLYIFIIMETNCTISAFPYNILNYTNYIFYMKFSIWEMDTIIFWVASYMHFIIILWSLQGLIKCLSISVLLLLFWKYCWKILISMLILCKLCSCCCLSNCDFTWIITIFTLKSNILFSIYSNY